MCIKERCFNANLFPVKNYKNRVITISNIKVYPPPPDPANPLYCILIWYIDTIYISGKLGPGGGGTYLKIENGDDHIFFKYLTGNKFALTDISMFACAIK